MSARLALLGVASLALATPALAQHSLPPPPPGVADAQGRVYDGPVPDGRPVWQGAQQQPMTQGGDRQYPADWEAQRENWLTQCRRNQSSGGKRVGGAVIGGLVGGVVGNRVAGRGNRVIGTVAGATVGAVAGGAIGDAADKRAARDWCEDYLERNISWGPGYGQGQNVVGYGQMPMTVMVPVAYVAVQGQTQQARECLETTVTEEWVPVYSPPRQRYIPPRPRPDKRVRIVPDKRVKIVPDKRVRY